MSRSGYTDDCEYLDLWRGAVRSATNGKRGQQFFKDLLAALDAMPEKVLIAGDLQDEEGDVCAIGSLGRARGIDMAKLDAEDSQGVAEAFGIAPCLAQEVVYMNDEWFDCFVRGNLQIEMTPQLRWEKMREWVAKQIKAEEKPLTQ